MKRLFTVILAFSVVAACLTSLCSCQKVENILHPSSIEDISSGGWATASSPEITEEFKAVFDKATEALTGAELKPVAYVAGQVVAGMNHCVLCRQTATVPDAKTYYALVYIYEKLDSTAEITRIVDSDIEAAPDDAGVPGGPTAVSSPVIPEDVMKVVDKATKEITGAVYSPLALLETRIASQTGREYTLLCEVTPVVPDAVSGYNIVHIVLGEDGEARVTDTESIG